MPRKPTPPEPTHHDHYKDDSATSRLRGAGVAEMRSPAGRHRDLTIREQQIVGLVRFGKQNKEIAFDLRLTEGTVKEYLHRIFRKVDVKNRTELAIWALGKQVAF